MEVSDEKSKSVKIVNNVKVENLLRVENVCSVSKTKRVKT